ncbi:hypothetical protein H0H93_004636 [Arthromyces matolae]|nr:hypothetical protein H0H93_004636 [Arthromyces matolae]
MPISSDTQHAPPHSFEPSSITNEIQQVIATLREAAADPSPLTRLIQDPAIIKLAQLKKDRVVKSSTKVASIRKMAIEEEEHELARLKVMLRWAANHLEVVSRRADEREALLQFSENQEKAIQVHLEASQLAKSLAEVEVQTAVGHARQLQLELHGLELDVQHMKTDLRHAEKLRDEYEKAAVRAEEQVKHYKSKLLDYKMRNNDLEYNHRIELLNTLNEGRIQGFKEGRVRGYEEGKAGGRKG